jgi:hypothetical protein
MHTCIRNVPHLHIDLIKADLYIKDIYGPENTRHSHVYFLHKGTMKNDDIINKIKEIMVERCNVMIKT